MKLKIFLLIIFQFFSIFLYTQVNVRGYYRKDGTYVRPHTRTAPNSTITDNYTYPGNYNPNLEYNKPISSDSNSGSNDIWVNGYYRKDGTYVKGHYRSKSKNYRKSNNYSENKIKYNRSYSSNNYKNEKTINTLKVNLRSQPNFKSDNILTTLNYGDNVKIIKVIGKWSKVQVNNNYVQNIGYIKNSYLSNKTVSTYYSDKYNSTNNYNYTNTSLNEYKVIAFKAFFYSQPNKKTMKRSFLVYGDEFIGIKKSKYFVYTKFKSSNGKTTKGWLIIDDIIQK